ncbi:carboxymuconolactone decarboxylase family protein [Costertonia aggregata]|uniref:Carboxymuconolactone decarboxylase family protein n=1 Tax=Costertonia aggregata TaxID=343403 RepID=A0A7H9ANM5_9FLAO|nr:carboxymuconolactone decarboxylase family protein [Costertonia aggregata]QLG45052.1 carboxymuconolactone decarboxylase family protein [Costertonia aggregata]
MMSRIAPILDYETSELAPLFEQAEKWMGFQPNDGLIMAHKPNLLISFFTLAKAVYDEGYVNSGLKRMIGHVASLSAGCEYCSAHTAYSAGKHGVSEEKMKSIWNFQTSPLFSDKEKAALNLALKSSIVPNQVSDEDFDELKKHFCDAAIVEIMGVISLFGFLNRWNSTFKTELEILPKKAYESIKTTENA